MTQAAGSSTAERRVPLVLIVAAAVCGAALAAVESKPAEMPPRLLINESASAPRGLYLRRDGAEPAVGRRVVLAPPTPAARRYLAGLGAPPGMRLLKRVAAVGGEPVCAARGQMMTPRGAVTASAHDRRGRPLPAWSGCRILAADELLLLGDTPWSFDSRHFGPVRRAQVQAIYVEVLRW